MIAARNLAIAKDYYNTPMSIEEIELKHGIPRNSATAIAKRIDFRRFQREREYHVVKVEKRDLEAVKMILEGNNIHFDVPEKFEMTEYIESKINNQ